MVPISLRLWDSLHEPIVAAAVERNVSLNWLINQVLKESLERLEDPDEFKVLA
jgi:predicted HicB family RNase H-like nuclease